MPELIREKSDVNLEVLLEHVADLEGLESKIGWFESAKYDEKTPVAMVAAQNEFGNVQQNIPPRPFFRPTIAEHQKLWQQQMASGAKAIMSGNETAATVMEKISGQAAGQVREKITEIQSPSLKGITIRNRLLALERGKSPDRRKPVTESQVIDFIIDNHTITKPLVFAGILLNTITYIVHDGPEVHPWIDQAVDKDNVYGSRPT